MNIYFPIWLILIDYLFGIIMWIMITKFVFNILLPDDNNFYINRLLKKITDPIFTFIIKSIPFFIIKPIIPLYVAWLIFMFRVYLLPLLNGYSSIGIFAFIFEKDIFSFLSSSFLYIALYLNYGL
jgi:hypothetical protein|tara:strand:- start:1184 stop:1558 length:375 start_codon:yes stop_codon:yes gene_type:complete